MLAAPGLEVALEAEVEQGRQARIGAYHDVAAVPAVTPARPAMRPVFLAQKRQAAATPVARLHRNPRFVDEFHQVDSIA
jgi:hypothetical protein